MRPGRPDLRGAAVVATAAAVFAMAGCVYQEVPELDTPVLELRAAPTVCTGLWHMPNRNFAGSLSWGLYATLLMTDDNNPLPELDGATISVDGLPDAQATVDGDGVVVGVLPLTALGKYPISGIGVTKADGTEYSISVAYDFEVGPEASDVSCDGDSAEAQTIERGILMSALVDF